MDRGWHHLHDGTWHSHRSHDDSTPRSTRITWTTTNLSSLECGFRFGQNQCTYEIAHPDSLRNRSSAYSWSGYDYFRTETYPDSISAGNSCRHCLSG